MREKGVLRRLAASSGAARFDDAAKTVKEQVVATEVEVALRRNRQSLDDQVKMLLDILLWIPPNPSLDAIDRAAARKTVRRLQLDSAENNETRARHFQNYLKND